MSLYRPTCPVEGFCLIDSETGKCVHCGARWRLFLHPDDLRAAHARADRENEQLCSCTSLIRDAGCPRHGMDGDVTARETEEVSL